MDSNNSKYEISSKVGIDKIVLRTTVKVVECDKFHEGIKRKEVRTKTDSLALIDGKGWTIGDNTYSFVKVSPKNNRFRLEYSTNMTKNKVRISLFVKHQGEKIIGNFNNRTAAQVIEAFEETKDVLLEIYGIELQGVAEIVSLELNRTVAYSGDVHRLMQNLEYLRMTSYFMPYHVTKSQEQNEESEKDYHSWKLAHIRRSSMHIYVKSNQIEKKEEMKNAGARCRESFVRIEFVLQNDGCSKYLENANLYQLTDVQVRNIYARLYSDYVEAAMVEYKKKRMEEFQTKVKDIPKDRNGKWYCKLNKIIDNGHKTRCTRLVFSMDELLEGIDLLPDDNWIKIYRKKHKGKLLDRIQANVFDTYEEKESLQEVFDAFFERIKPDAVERVDILHLDKPTHNRDIEYQNKKRQRVTETEQTTKFKIFEEEKNWLDFDIVGAFFKQMKPDGIE